MNEERFEELSRALAASVSRGRMLRLVGGAMLGGAFAGWRVLLETEDAEARCGKKKRGERCTKGEQCCTTFCQKKRCQCGAFEDPCASGIECCTGVCIDNACTCKRAGSRCINIRDCCGFCKIWKVLQCGGCFLSPGRRVLLRSLLSRYGEVLRQAR